MTGAISPRMRLELLAARLLAGSESGFATAAPAPASSGMPPAAASSTSTTSAASGTGASGFAGASRGGFAGASHGGFSGAARNQQAAAPQSTASHESVGGNGPVNGPVSDRPAGSLSVQPAVATAAAGAAPAANAGWGAPAASPAVPAQPVTSPAASDNRSIDEKWDAAVAALPETIREYVSRDKVPTVKFGPNRKGLPCLSMTFDKSLSQHAFALAVDNSGKKAAAVVMDAVRNEFGANAVIAPSAVAANGERVESVKRMSRSNWPRSSSRLPWPRLDWPRRVWARAWAFIWGARRKLRSRLQQAKPRTQTTAIEPDNPVHPRQRRTGVTMTLGPSRP